MPCVVGFGVGGGGGVGGGEADGANAWCHSCNIGDTVSAVLPVVSF